MLRLFSLRTIAIVHIVLLPYMNFSEVAPWFTMLGVRCFVVCIVCFFFFCFGFSDDLSGIDSGNAR